MHFDGFLEPYADKAGYIRNMDSRCKLVFVSACLLLAVASPGPAAPVTVGVVCLALTLASGAPLRAVAFRMAEPLFFALILAAMRTIMTRGEALFSLHILGFTCSISAEGIRSGVFIMSRVFGAVTAVLFLTMTTSVNRLLSAAAQLRAPKALIEISLFAYRYVFVLIEDAVTVYHAQKGRLGYSGFVRGIRSLATLAGAVFLRAYGQAEATGAAMAMRGYTGEYVPCYRESLRAGDAALLSVLFIPCLAAYLWTL